MPDMSGVNPDLASDSSPAATGASRSRSVTQATATAAPLRSAPLEAAVPTIPEPVAAPAPVAVADSILANDALPIAGVAGLGLLALFGAGMAIRRRRDDEDEFFEQDVEYVDAEPEAMIEPVPIAAPVAAAAAATTLPSGFDISRFGPNVQAAYRGPSEDNPSLSLKRRLTVGSFLDKKAAEAAHSAPVETTAKPATTPAWAARTDSDFMFRREGHTANLKRAFQS